MDRYERLEREIEKLEKEADDMERHMMRTVNRVDRIEEKLIEILDNTRFTRRALITGLIGSSFSGVIALIIWLIQRG